MSYVRDPRRGPSRPPSGRDGRGNGRDGRASAGDGGGGRFAGIPFAAALSVVGLVVVAIASLSLLRGAIPTFGGGGGDNGPIRTPTPSNVVVIDPRAEVPGILAYVKDGNVWVQRGDKATQLTSSGTDESPSFSPDGAFIYFIRTQAERGKWRINNELRNYRLDTPYLMRVAVDGSAAPETLLSGRYTPGSFVWQVFMRQPKVAPDGHTVALITDGPDPTSNDTVVKFWDLTTKKLTTPRIPEISPLGHQDPAWSPDGSSILLVKDARDGTRGAPVILRYDLTTKKTTAVTSAGYLQPSWSPDGNYLAATRTSSLGTDVALLDAKTGGEMLRITNDEHSFNPVWSPAGNAVVYLRVDRGVVDLWLARLSGTPGTWTVTDTLAMTVSAGLDAASGVAWFIPANELPTPPPATAPPASAGPAAS